MLRYYKSEAEVFKALAHPTRLFIVHAIHEDRLCVQELTRRIGADMSTVSKHINVLKQNGIIYGEKVKNHIYYTLRIPCVLEFMQCARKVLDQEK